MKNLLIALLCVLGLSVMAQQKTVAPAAKTQVAPNGTSAKTQAKPSTGTTTATTGTQQATKKQSSPKPEASPTPVVAAAPPVATPEASSPKDFSISGVVNEPAEGYIYLQQAINNGGVKSLDSLKMKASMNTFTFKGKVPDDGGFYLVNFYNKQRVLLLLEGGEKIEVVADGYDEPSRRGKANVSGSQNMIHYQKVMGLVEGLQEKVAKWNQDFAVASQRNDKTTQAQIQNQFQAEQKNTIGKIKEVIPQMGTSLAALYSVNFLNPDEEIDFLSELADKFAKEKPNNKQAQAFIASVAAKRGLSVGAVAPEISLSSPDGKLTSLASLKGKVVLIDFWASWCGPCRQENPNVVRMYDRFKGKGFEIFGVSLDSDKNRWTSAIKQDNLTWAHVSDLKGWKSQGAALYQVQAIPQTFLIDKEGRIIAKNLRGEALEAKLTELFQ